MTACGSSSSTAASTSEAASAAAQSEAASTAAVAEENSASSEAASEASSSEAASEVSSEAASSEAASSEAASTEEAASSDAAELTTVTAGKVKYNFITSGKDYAYAINDKLATDNNGEYSKGSIVELGEKIEAMAAELFAGPGAVRKTLHKYVSAQ